MNFVLRDQTNIERMINEYEDLVTSLVNGYTWISDSVYEEYTNDMSVRDALEKVIDTLTVSERERISTGDRRLKALLITTTEPIIDSATQDFFWWYGYPKNSPKLESALRELRLIK